MVFERQNAKKMQATLVTFDQQQPQTSKFAMKIAINGDSQIGAYKLAVCVYSVARQVVGANVQVCVTPFRLQTCQINCKNKLFAVAYKTHA